MAVVEIHPERIYGPWIEGFVLDKHVIKSVPIGYYGEHMQFDTTRSPLGELVYQLKNRNGPPDDIVDTAAVFAEKQWTSMFDCVVSAPPSVARQKQPAILLAEGIGAKLGLQVLGGAISKAQTPPMKNVPPTDRDALLKEAIQAGATSVAGIRVLIIDDLWQTGGTMRRIAEVLTAMGAAEIRALAMTRTK